MRFFVSFIILGVILFLFIGVSSISEQYMCSRKNFLNFNEDGMWGGLWVKIDLVCELNENVVIIEEDDLLCE